MSIFRRRPAPEPPAQSGWAPGEVAPIANDVQVITRPEDGHTIVRWRLYKGDAPVVSLDLRAEHAREFGRQFTDAADLVDETAPDQDWSYDPIRDAWENRDA